MGPRHVLTTTGLKVLGAVGSARVEASPNLPGSPQNERRRGKGWVTVGAGLRFAATDGNPQPTPKATQGFGRGESSRHFPSFSNGM